MRVVSTARQRGTNQYSLSITGKGVPLPRKKIVAMFGQQKYFVRATKCLVTTTNRLVAAACFFFPKKGSCVHIAVFQNLNLNVMAKRRKERTFSKSQTESL